VTARFLKDALLRRGVSEWAPPEHVSEPWVRYVQNVSSVSMAISLETAVWLDHYASHLPPGSLVLDMGSGFTTSVLLRAGCRVVTCDTSPEWLAKTLEFCTAEGLRMPDARVWPCELPAGEAVFVSYDLAPREKRPAVVPGVLAWKRPTYVDDFNYAPLAKAVYRAVHNAGHVAELHAETRDTHGRYGALVIPARRDRI
jgi:hypothetical protein